MKILSRFRRYIRSRLVYKFCFAFLVIITALCSFIYFAINSIVTNTLYEQHKQRGISFASNLASNVVDFLLVDNSSQIQLLLKNTQTNEQDAVYIFIVDVNKQVPAHTFPGGFPTDLKKLNQWRDHQSYNAQLIETEQGNLLDISVPILQGSLGYVHIGLSRQNIDQKLSGIRLRVLLICILACVAAIILSFFFSRRITKPITELTDISTMMADGDLEQQVELGSVDEVGRLARSFDHMRDSIRQRILELKQGNIERKKIETHLRQTQKIEALGSLAGGIAHDFNNILTPIIGFTEMTMDEIKKGTSSWENLQEVQDASYRAKELVGRILAFSRKGEQHLQSADLVSVLKEVIQLLRASIPSTIEISQQIDEQELYILADSTQIHQVVMNLANNACHAMRDQRGVLTISLNTVSFSKKQYLVNDMLPAGSYCRLSVSDTGEGMTEDLMSRIFEPYFTTKKAGEGSGLGLSVVHGIVESHGGYIDIRSSPGSGTTFTIFFPLLEDWEAYAKPEKIKNTIAAGRGSILLVDDDPHIVQLIKKELEGLGCTVLSFTDSPSALRVFMEDPFAYDLLITDQTMPGITGMELALQVLAVRSDLPIILCTGYSKHVSAQKAEEIGIREYVLKPFVLADFGQLVQKHLPQEPSDESASRVMAEAKVKT